MANVVAGLGNASRRSKGGLDEIHSTAENLCALSRAEDRFTPKLLGPNADEIGLRWLLIDH
jgi:hypothetical protein